MKAARGSRGDTICGLEPSCLDLITFNKVRFEVKWFGGEVEEFIFMVKSFSFIELLAAGEVVILK